MLRDFYNERISHMTTDHMTVKFTPQISGDIADMIAHCRDAGNLKYTNIGDTTSTLDPSAFIWLRVATNDGIEKEARGGAFNCGYGFEQTNHLASVARDPSARCTPNEIAFAFQVFIALTMVTSAVLTNRTGIITTQEKKLVRSALASDLSEIISKGIST
ncbi:unnamed protein product, partial [Prorocentrum cordatum]